MLLAQQSDCFEAEWAPALEIVRKLLERQRIHQNQSDADLLKAYVHEWSNYSVLIIHLPTPFAFIERGVIRPAVGIARVEGRHAETLFTVRNVMYTLWNETVFESIYQRLLSAANHLISEERSGQSAVSKSELVVGVREGFVNAGHGDSCSLLLYKKFFETQYITSLQQFYKERANQVLKDGGILNYMAYAFEKVQEEEDRAKKYLDPSSYERLVEASVKILVVDYLEGLLAEGASLIQKNDVERLRMLYGLVTKTENGVKPLLNTLADHIKSEGLKTMKENAATVVNDSEKYVEQLLGMYERFSKLVREAFCDDSRFLTVRDKSFQDVINNTEVFKLELVVSKQRGGRLPPESKCPELLANYCDLLLRKSALTKKLSSEEIDERLNKVLLLLKYVSNKDVFMRYHKNHLSRRLILELTADQEKEENLVKMFRDNGMPTDYVNRLYRMLQDIEVNKDLSTAFKKSIGANNNIRNTAENINLKILNAGAWSRGREKAHITLPREIEEIIPEIEDFYKKKHVGRKLNWAHSWSTGVIGFQNEAGKYDLEVSTHQMAVLFIWNDRPKEKLSFETIRLATELSDTDLRRTLGSLLQNPKVKVQVMQTDCSPPNPKDFTDSTLFWINQQFAVVKNDKPQPRGRINLVNRLVVAAENVTEEEHEDIIRLREFRTQEAIIKILKTHRSMNQLDLQNRLIEMLRNMFAPSRKMIKEQLEWLIEQQFIGRDPNDITKFNYLA
uniref:Cullin-5 n=1 Tax=Bursaphelenchus xylophilus TaxID=6326 RepID=A0A1I7SBJ6_BURXY